MRVVISGRTATLGPKQMLGQGGEACVYLHRGQAAKIYHPGPPRDLQRRIDKLRDFPSGLPGAVLGPTGWVEDTQGNPIGFTMKAIGGGEDLKRLSSRRFREGVISNGAVVDLFGRLHDVLTELHRLGVVVGDLNDANVLFTGTDPWLIDTDSMQYGSHRCIVGHERFLDPRLYGVDLSKTQSFTAETDWYAFSVLLFSSLLYVHPFGGVHPTLPTFARRAEARHSILRSDVKRPKVAAHWRILPDDITAWFEHVFEKDLRDAFPRRLLDMKFQTCRCGLEHARKACPDCASSSTVIFVSPTVQKGRCRAVQAFKTRGRILGAVIQGNLKYIYDDEGTAKREDGQRVTDIPTHSRMRFGISARRTWIAQEKELVCVRDRSVVARTQTELFGANPVFAANASRCFRIDDDWLTDADTGTRWGQVMGGQTWFSVGDALGYGFYRAGHMTVHFLFRTNTPGISIIDGPQLVGRLVDVDAVFDEKHALVSFQTEDAGVSSGHVCLFGADGEMRGQRSGPPDSSALLASVHGKAILGGRIVVATDDGLMTVSRDSASGLLVEGNLFVETEPFIHQGAEIRPGPGGSLYIITPKEIVQISLA